MTNLGLKQGLWGGEKGGLPPCLPLLLLCALQAPVLGSGAFSAFQRQRQHAFPPPPPPTCSPAGLPPLLLECVLPLGLLLPGILLPQSERRGGGRREGPHNPCCPVVPFSTLLMRAPHSLQGGSGNEGLLASIRDLLWIPITQSAYRCEV